MKTTRIRRRFSILPGLSSLLASGLLAAASINAPAAELNNREITNALELELLLDDSISANGIDISVTDGIVTLKGESPHLLSKERSARIAETVKGVRSVVNLLEVNPPEDVQGKELKKAINSALLSDPAAESYEIKVKTDDRGNVTLSGAVDSWQEKTLAAKVAKGVRGVTSVENEIEIDYNDERPDFEIQKGIESRLRWNTLVDDGLIDVAVEDGIATLSGTVGSAAEKRQARYDAWAIAGVKDVNASELSVERWARDPDMRTGKYVSKSPAVIEEALEDAFLLDPRVLSFNVDPDVTMGGTVTLKGQVDNLAAKQAAERIARHTVGVNRVYNNIKVRPEGKLSDPQIATKIDKQFTVDPLVESFEIDTIVKSGTAYLYEYVDSVTEKLRAADVASRVEGVTEVANRLLVSDTDDHSIYDPYVWEYGWYYAPKYQDTLSTFSDDVEIKEDIQSQLFWSPFVDSDEVKISVQDGVATLTGKVDSWNERLAATENALEGGADWVKNRIEVNQ